MKVSDLKKIPLEYVNFAVMAISILAIIMMGCTDADKADTYLVSDAQGQFSLNGSLVEYNNRALFTMSELQLNDVKYNNNGSTSWRDPNHIQLWFQVCGLADLASNGNIINHSFSIKSELGEHPHEVVSSGGCLKWSEEVNFNYFASSVHLVLHFHFTPNGDASAGRIVRRFAWNPWDKKRKTGEFDGGLDITNLAQKSWPLGRAVLGKKDILDALRGDLKIKDVAPAQLFTRGVTVQPTVQEAMSAKQREEMLAAMSPEERKIKEAVDKYLENKTGVHLEFGVEMNPMVRVEDSTGIPHDISLTSGRFKVFMQLLATGLHGEDKSIILTHMAPSPGLTWAITENGLMANLPMVLNKQSTDGNLALAMKIIPVDLPASVRPLSVVYDLGRYDNLMRTQTLQIKKDGVKILSNEAYDKFISEATNFNPATMEVDYAKTLEDIAAIRNSELFYFRRSEFRFIRILPGETATDRTFQYQVTSCIVDGRFGNAVGPGLQFDVTTEDRGREVTIRRESDLDGCLTWFGLVSHKYYHKEVLVPKKALVKFVGVRRKIKEDGTAYADKLAEETEKKLVDTYVRDFEYYMNPWDEKFTFGWDGRFMPPDYYKETLRLKENAPISRLFMADFRYETLGFRYEIDKYMNLKVKKTILLKTYPIVLKYNSIVAGRSATIKLRDGVYLMKVALQKDYLDPSARGIQLGSVPERGSGEGIKPNATMEISDKDSTEFKEDKKQYISVQEKLVRVLGGMIVTPVEFEVEDLRLMRIRNQFFIQLQTIDENKLRLAAKIDEALSGLEPVTASGDGEKSQGSEQVSYLDILELTKKLSEINSDLDKFVVEQQAFDAAEQVQNTTNDRQAKLLGEQKQVKQQLKEMFGLVGGKIDASLSEQEKEQKFMQIFQRLETYRAMNVDEQSAFRDAKYHTVSKIMRRIGERSSEIAEEAEQRMKTELANSGGEIPDDPFQALFHMNMRADDEAIYELFSNDLEALADLKFTDFTTSPLTPNFSFDLLRNDGPGLTEETADESGLPSRTFVGPLTFLLNTNSSSLRPTDILNESYCLDATCSVAESMDLGLPVGPVERTTGLDKSGERVFDPHINFLGNPVNHKYQNSSYFGSLKNLYNYSVDDLIVAKKKLNEDYVREMEVKSQVVNFLQSMDPHAELKFVSLDESGNGAKITKVKENCLYSTPVDKISENCFAPIKNSPLNISTGDFMAHLNDRKAIMNDSDEKSEEYRGNGTVFKVEDVNALIEKGVDSEDIAESKRKDFFHRMCFVLAHNLFTPEFVRREMELSAKYSEEWYSFSSGKSVKDHAKDFFTGNFFNWQKRKNLDVATDLEELCHDFADNYFDHENPIELLGEKVNSDAIDTRAYPPIVFERKLLVKDTTGRYMYRGGKSLNINVGTSFGMDAGEYFNTGNNLAITPVDVITSKLGVIGKSAKAADGAIEGVAAQAGKVAKNGLGAFAGEAIKFLAGGFRFALNYGISESVGRKNGTNVNTQTFLVSQQATIDIEIGEFERCMVARLNPLLIKVFSEDWSDGLEEYNAEMAKQLKPEEHLKYAGILICEGNTQRSCEPVKEKYYYFTQHFTEGDMLDTADLYNHPWLLQMRGYRDFQTFVSMIGARKHKYLDANYLMNYLHRMGSDIKMLFNDAHDTFGTNYNQNIDDSLVMVDQKEDAAWPLAELGKVYFNVLPTFPGMYTYSDKDPEIPDPEEWPNYLSDPAESFDNSCNVN